MAVRRRLSRELADVRVAVQGVGAVGLELCRGLHGEGASLVVADVDQERAQSAVELFGAERVTAAEIYGAEADVFAPCALGGVIDDRTIDGLSARVVAGAANVQLAEPRHGDELHHRGILYAPDYVINAGGVINGSGEILGTYDAASARRDVLAIGPRLADLFDRAAAEAQAPGRVADAMAEAVLEAARERRVARARS
jgi:leucine dehydrogenase